MNTIYYSIVEAEAEKTTYFIREDGLCEVVMPKGTLVEVVSDFFGCMDKGELAEIADSQKKAKEAFRGNVSIASVLQFCPTEMVDRIVAGTVYDMACQYEAIYSRISGVTTSTISFPGMDTVSRQFSKMPDEARYRVTLSENRVNCIRDDYEDAIKKIHERANMYKLSFWRELAIINGV